MASWGRVPSDPSANEAGVRPEELKPERKIGSVTELPEALQGDGSRLALTCVTVPLLEKGFWTLLIEED